MKGTPDAPMCGFSNAVVQILNVHGVNFEGHNVLSNEDLRSGIEIEIEINLLTKSGPQEGIYK
jgi:glutaredoxin-related protein